MKLVVGGKTDRILESTVLAVRGILGLVAVGILFVICYVLERCFHNVR